MAKLIEGFTIEALRFTLENGQTKEYQLLDDNEDVLIFDKYEEALEYIQTLEPSKYMYSINKIYVIKEEK